jgi:hypothetical protein
MVKENTFIDSQKLENDDVSTYTKDSKISVQKLSKLDSSSLFTRSVSDASLRKRHQRGELSFHTAVERMNSARDM